MKKCMTKKEQGTKTEQGRGANSFEDTSTTWNSQKRLMPSSWNNRRAYTWVGERKLKIRE